MGRSDFEQNYQDLEQISDKGADIYGSELCRDILHLEPYSLDLLNMQLEQERFFQRIEECRLQGGLPDQDRISRTFHRSACAYLEEWLARYDAGDRRGILLELLTALEGPAHWTEEQIAAAARLPEERLTALAAGEVERYAIRLCAEPVELDGGKGKARVHDSSRAEPIAAALSAAAYAEYPELRVSPGLIAFTSSAAANTACTEIREKTGESACMGAYMELMIAVASLAEWTAVPIASAAGGAGGAKSLVKAFLALFFTDLVLLLGAGAAGAAAGAAAILAALAEAGAWGDHGVCAVPDEHTLPAQEAQDTHEAEEREEEREEDEEEDEAGDEWEFD